MEDLFKGFAEELELRKLEKAKDPFANFPSKQGPSAKDRKANEITNKMREKSGRQSKLESEVKASRKPGPNDVKHALNSSYYKKLMDSARKTFPHHKNDDHPDHWTAADHVSHDLKEAHNLTESQREEVDTHIRNTFKGT